MKCHTHAARLGRPVAFTLYSICASALLSLSLCVSASAQDTRYKLVSAADAAGQVEGNNDSSEASVSADGRFIAFTSKASNLVALPTNGKQNVFVRDLQAGTTRLVSVNKDGAGGGDGASSEPRVSADGRYVAYAYNYSGSGEKGNSARYDRVTGALSTLPDAGLCHGRSPGCDVIAFSPSLSADGRFVAFGETMTGDGFNEAAYFGDFLSLITTNVTTQPVKDTPSELATRAVISADGSSVAFPTRNDLVPQNPDSDAANIYRFAPSVSDPAGVAGLIQFGTLSFRVEENAGSVVVPVIRGTFGGAAAGTATVEFATADRTAKAGSDYTATSGTLTFGPGEDVKFISVPLVNDSVYEGVETFAIGLSNPTGGYAIGGVNPTATVVIHDSIKPTVTISDASAKEGKTPSSP